MATIQPAPIQTPLSAEALFDSVGPAYEVAFANLSPQLASIQWLKSQLSNSKPATILDIGCGTGRPVCSELADAGHNVLGIDISSAMINDARQKVPNAKFEKLDMHDFNPTPGTFDAITVYFSMIASVTQDQIRNNIEKIYTWLKPGGIFVFATVPVVGNNLEIRWMGKPLTASSLSAEDAVDTIKKAGFEVVHQDESAFLPRAVEAGICQAEDVWEEPHLFVYAKRA